MAIREVQPPTERGSRDRSQGILLRRRHGQLGYTRIERRRPRLPGFDVAAALELHLDRFPTREGLLVLLDAWLYQSPEGGLGEDIDGYAETLARAKKILREAPDSATAIAMLQRARAQ